MSRRRALRDLPPPEERIPGQEKCVVKLAWRTELQATNAIRRLRRVHTAAGRSMAEVHPYECPVCGRWHLTSQVRR